MNLSQLNIEELIKLRTNMILEKKSTFDISRIIDQKEREYSRMLTEEFDTSATGSPSGAVTGGDCYSGGVAYGNGGIGGMGAVSSPQPSSYAGSTIGNDWSNNGGTTGSGDVSIPFPGPDKMYQKVAMGKNHGARTGKKSREKKLDLKSLRNAFAKKQDYTAGSSRPASTIKVMNFDDFQKSQLTKVTKVKN